MTAAPDSPIQNGRLGLRNWSIGNARMTRVGSRVVRGEAAFPRGSYPPVSAIRQPLVLAERWDEGHVSWRNGGAKAMFLGGTGARKGLEWSNFIETEER